MSLQQTLGALETFHMLKTISWNLLNIGKSVNALDSMKLDIA